MAPTYRFRDRWLVPAPVATVHATLIDLERYPAWWPQILAVGKLSADDALVLCRSVLPYTLELRLHAVSRELPTIEVAVSGQLEGWVRWTLRPDGARTELAWEQQVAVRGWLSPFAVLLPPLLRWNHARMMAGGRTGLIDYHAEYARDQQ